ncbi:MAG TPA: type II toxin-antitoxin system VapC family toxin, partial [Candidatus Dormibacteraeota bacterium]|nr:type II toxin-antitoxin system VapC family toxin [Candidatus Dormibacteraeota bacterium]
MKRVYLDSSAFVKIVVNETESAALRKWLHSRAWTTSVLSRAEVLRAVRIHGAGAVETARRMLGLGELVRISPALLDLSASLGPVELRTLDAIHLAAASLLGRDLLAVVTYDQRMAAAAQS